MGLPASTNLPGARSKSAAWTDANNNFWLFGGHGFDSAENFDIMNDLWKYNPATRQWTWVGGPSLSTNAQASYGVYGTQGVGAASNFPGARLSSSSWSDKSGSFWLFGGKGFTSTSYGELNDLWKYDPGTNRWTWVTGSSSAVYEAGNYGALGAASATNVPSARRDAVTWTDTSGNLWLFGGRRLDAANNYKHLNDLWKFNPTTTQWTWMAGSDVGNVPGIYGTRGVAAVSNFPGGRVSSVGITDASGNFWLYGGYAYDSAGTLGMINDLWKYDPSNNVWTWMSGSKFTDAAGVYGTKNVAALANTPSAREDMVGWGDASGNIWIFGGQDWGNGGSLDSLNDLWKYSPSTNMWTWVSGSDTFGDTGSYYTIGTPIPANTPGARFGSAVWVDALNDFWLFGGFMYNDVWKFRP